MNIQKYHANNAWMRDIGIAFQYGIAHASRQGNVFG